MLEFFIRFILLLHTTGAPVPHALAAMQAESPTVSAELLIAQAWAESRWTGTGVSRLENGKRRTGAWPGKFPSYFSGPYFCGASQLKRKTEKACKAIGRATLANYTEAEAHIRAWVKACQAKYKRRDLTCALSGYGGGWPGITLKGRAYRYARKIQRWEKAYKSEISRIQSELFSWIPDLDPLSSLHEQLSRQHHPSVDPSIPAQRDLPAGHCSRRVLASSRRWRSDQCRLDRRMDPLRARAPFAAF
jgi:hypothetical protein